MKLNTGTVMGHFSIENFKNPYLELTLDAQLSIAELLRFRPVEAIKHAEGKIGAEITIKGLVDDLRKNNGTYNISSGHVKMEASNIELLAGNKKISRCLTDLRLNGNSILIDEFSLKGDETDIQVKGKAEQVFGYLFNRETLKAQIDYQSEQVDGAAFLLTSSGNQQNDTVGFSLPDRIELDANFHIGAFKFHLFEAQQMEGQLSWHGKKFSLHHLSCKTMQGQVNLRGQIENAPDGKFLVSANAQLENLNIHELFKQCADFGQHEITYQHLNGVLSGKVELVSIWNKHLLCETDKLYALGDFIIKNGELKNYQPLESLSKYANVEDLRNLKFAELRNKIEISNRTVIIPDMDMVNNALNLSISGKHSFDNIVDYHFKIRLKELLAKKHKQQSNEYGEEDETGKGLYLYLTMTGPASNPKISYDKVTVKKKITQDLITEKGNVLNVLRHELGIGKDTTIKEKQNNKSDELEFEKE
jgi:hypothetical protein